MLEYDSFLRLLFPDTDPIITQMEYGALADEADTINCFPKTKAAIAAYRCRNKQQYTIMLGHIREITKRFNQNNIRYFIFKGTTLAYDIYRTPAQRRSTDIDLVISPHDLPLALDLLGEAGFEYEHTPVNARDFTRYHSKTASHFNDFTHRDTGIIVEIHLSTVYRSTEDSEYQIANNCEKFLFSSIRYVVIDNFRVPTLGVTETLFSLMEHFTKHIINDIRLSLDDPNVCINIPIKSLMDCYQLIHRYSNQLDLEHLALLSSQFMNGDRILFACQALQCMFGNLREITFLIEKISPSDDKGHLFSKVGKRLLNEDFLYLCQHYDDKAYIHSLYWSAGNVSAHAPGVFRSEDEKYQYFQLFDNSCCQYNAMNAVNATFVRKSIFSEPAACFQISADQSCLHTQGTYKIAGYLQNAGSISIEVFLIDPLYIGERYINVWCLTAAYSCFSLLISTSCSCTADEIAANQQNRVFYKVSIERDLLSFTIDIPLQSIPLISNTPELFYFDVYIYEFDSNRNFLRNLRLWDYTPETDRTTMQRIPLPGPRRKKHDCI